jgi:hypothetical protein
VSIIHQPSDLKQLRYPEITLDEEATALDYLSLDAYEQLYHQQRQLT